MAERRIHLMRPTVGGEELELIREVIESRTLTDGPFVRAFERELGSYVGSKHAVSCTSATTALELALRSIGVGPGDEVIVPDFTHPATALAVLTLGAEPVLVDVDLASYNTTADHLAAAITPRTKAAIPVSIFGNPLDMDRINAVRDRSGVRMIEDAACTLGARLGGKPVGSLTDLTVFSFHPRKLFSTGEGGMVTTDDDGWAATMNSTKRFGVLDVDGESKFAQYGTNYRLSAILAAVGLAQVRKIEAVVADRRQQAARYDRLLDGVPGLLRPTVLPNAVHNYQTYAVYLSEPGLRDRVLRRMRSAGIEVQIGTYALHRQPFFGSTRRVGDLSNSALLYERVLSLPLHHELTPSDQEQVVQSLLEDL